MKDSDFEISHGQDNFLMKQSVEFPAFFKPNLNFNHANDVER